MAKDTEEATLNSDPEDGIRLGKRSGFRMPCDFNIFVKRRGSRLCACHLQDKVGIMEYSDKVMEHFRSPQNCGTLSHPDASFAYGDPSCGDAVIFFIKVKEGIIEDVSYLVYGCCAAVASSSMASTLVKGRTLNEGLKITDGDIERALDGLPEGKKHCSNLGAGAIHGVIKKYMEANKD